MESCIKKVKPEFIHYRKIVYEFRLPFYPDIPVPVKDTLSYSCFYICMIYIQSDFIAPAILPVTVPQGCNNKQGEANK